MLQAKDGCIIHGSKHPPPGPVYPLCSHRSLALPFRRLVVERRDEPPIAHHPHELFTLSSERNSRQVGAEKRMAGDPVIAERECPSLEEDECCRCCGCTLSALAVVSLALFVFFLTLLSLEGVMSNPSPITPSSESGGQTGRKNVRPATGVRGGEVPQFGEG